MALKGDLGNIRNLKRNLRAMPITVAHDIASRAAPAMTDETTTAFKAGRKVYGEPWPVGADGNPVTLVRTGAVKRLLSFTSTGTQLRAILGPKYARFLIGKYGILPNGDLPAAWSLRLNGIVSDTKVEL